MTTNFENKHAHNLRLLNFDDLYLLKLLKGGITLTVAAKELNLTQPAITQRLKKIEFVFKTTLFKKIGRNLKLTRDGFHICNQATSALALMQDLRPEESVFTVNIGTRPEVGRSWLWPALAALRKDLPNINMHLFFGSGEEIMSGLHDGRLDVILTSTPLSPTGYQVINVTKETYVFVGSPEISKCIKEFTDLKKYVLIEHDPSLPFLHYLLAEDRTQLAFKDVWYVENTVLMTEAIMQGFGVGIVPAYLANPYLQSKKLRNLRLPVKIGHDFFKLIARTDRDINFVLKHLSNQLIRKGLS